MGRRWFLVSLAVVAIAAAVALYFARRKSPARAATLLPPAQGALYIDVELLRHAGVFRRSGPAERDPDFEDFVRQTGFDFERDLDEAGFALHTPPTAGRGDDYPRFSEVFVGRIDEARAAAYFQKIAKQSEQYRGETIYTIPHDGRTLRVAILDARTAAASNTDSPDAIHAIVDAVHGGGPENALLRDHYGAVPFGSVAWVIAKVASPPGRTPPGAPNGLTVPSWLRDVAGGSTVVAALRVRTALQFRAVAFAPGEPEARRIAESASSWLAVFRTLQQGASGTDPDIKAAFDSLRIEQQQNRAVLSADVPLGVLKKFAAETQLPGR